MVCKKSNWYWFVNAEQCEQSQNYDGAPIHYEAALNIDPSHDLAPNNLFVLLRDKLNDYDGAWILCLNALTIWKYGWMGTVI